MYMSIRASSVPLVFAGDAGTESAHQRTSPPVQGQQPTYVS